MGGGSNCERSVCRCEQESVTEMQSDTFALAAFKTKETPNTLLNQPVAIPDNQISAFILNFSLSHGSEMNV